MNRSVVIIPTYNEAMNLPRLLNSVMALEGVEVLFVDGGSTDGTQEIIKKAREENGGRVQYIFQMVRDGLGRAYLEGMTRVCQKGSFKYVFEMDADLSHEPERISYFIKLLDQKKGDVIIGSRYLNGGCNVVGWPLSRLLLSRGAAHYTRFWTRLPVEDPTSGFKGFRVEVIRSILQKLRGYCLSGYAFQVQTIFYAWHAGYTLYETPIIFRERESGASKMNWSIVKEALINIPKLGGKKDKWIKQGYHIG